MCKAPTALSQDRKYSLLGYVDILEKAPPNGASVHDLKQEITVLRLHLQLGWDITKDFEEKVKGTIRRIYHL